jgi:hypothetical protein
MVVRKYVAVSLGSVALLALSAGAASAGEVTGSGRDTGGPAHANSICTFSGLNDTPDAPGAEGGRVQSYGQIVRAGGKAFAPSPGLLCNGHNFPFPEAFPDEGP